jgi:hypothetical protein
MSIKYSTLVKRQYVWLCIISYNPYIIYEVLPDLKDEPSSWAWYTPVYQVYTCIYLYTWCTPVVPAIQKAEVGESLEPMSLRTV